MSILNKTNTIDGIVASFNKNISDLEKLSSTAFDKAAQKGSEIAKLSEEQNELRAEGLRASTIADNFKKLIGTI